MEMIGFLDMKNKVNLVLAAIVLLADNVLNAQPVKRL
jgi:hypothetical protein